MKNAVSRGVVIAGTLSYILKICSKSENCIWYYFQFSDPVAVGEASWAFLRPNSLVRTRNFGLFEADFSTLKSEIFLPWKILWTPVINNFGKLFFLDKVVRWPRGPRAYCFSVSAYHEDESQRASRKTLLISIRAVSRDTPARPSSSKHPFA